MRMMRRWLGATCLAGAVAMVGLAPGASADGGGDVIEVRALDTCDPDTFNQALGEGACVPVRSGRGKRTTFEELLASFDPVAHTGAKEWRFSRTAFSIDEGDTIRVTNRGGEAHSFTEVPFFGGGCVPELNTLLGLTEVAADCPADFATVRGPGGSAELTGLAPGRHLFFCVIHPWMTATVEVEAD